MGGTAAPLVKAFATALVALCGAAVAPAPADAQTPGLPPIPIPQSPLANPPAFQGAAATPQPIEGIAHPPRHPFMAPNGRSNIHNDAFQTDTYEGAGPLGDGAEVSTYRRLAGERGSATTTTTRRSPSAPTGRPTWARSAA